MTSSAHLQREADAARVGLADTLGQLRDGVAPSALSGEAIALVKDSGLSILKSLADSARANPVPALLIGVFAGAKGFKHMDPAKFRMAVLWILVALAVLGLGKAGYDLWIAPV